MNKWCGVKTIKGTINKYHVIVPALPEFINQDLEIIDPNVSGKVLCKTTDMKLAFKACIEFNQLYEKYNQN